MPLSEESALNQCPGNVTMELEDKLLNYCAYNNIICIRYTYCTVHAQLQTHTELTTINTWLYLGDISMVKGITRHLNNRVFTTVSIHAQRIGSC